MSGLRLFAQFELDVKIVGYATCAFLVRLVYAAQKIFQAERGFAEVGCVYVAVIVSRCVCNPCWQYVFQSYVDIVFG